MNADAAARAARADSPNRSARFEYINRLVDDGYLQALSRTELAVLFILWRHADIENCTFVSRETVARKLNIRLENVRRALAALLTKGFILNDVEPVGRGHSRKRWLILPEQRGAQRAPVYRAPKGSAAEPRRGAQDGAKGGAARRQRRAQCAPPTERTEKNIPSTQAGSAGDDVVDAVAGAKEEERKRAVNAELAAVGVWKESWVELAERGDLLPLAIRVLRYRVPKGMQNHAVWIIDQIEADMYRLPPLLDPKLICEMIRSGDIVEVDGHAMRPGWVKNNDGGLYVFGEDVSFRNDILPTAQILPEKLTCHAIKLSSPTRLDRRRS